MTPLVLRVWDQRPGRYRGVLSRQEYAEYIREGLNRRVISLYLRAIDETVDRGLRRRIRAAVN